MVREGIVGGLLLSTKVDSPEILNNRIRKINVFYNINRKERFLLRNDTNNISYMFNERTEENGTL